MDAQVLLVDDIPDHAYVYQNALREHGYRVELAQTGRDALAKARAIQPDCAVIDIRLPDMSGWDLCREIKADRSTKKTSIVMLTRDISVTCAEDSAKAGCNAWLARPSAADDLVRAVRHVLAQPSDTPATTAEAILGMRVCPACASDQVRATLRVSTVQYYCCRRCGLCWRVETTAVETTDAEPT
jgi:CheY-like chemotaxis protein